jgi:hypothetical protein
MSTSTNNEELEENFKNTFSLENMRNLINHIINFGNDEINKLLNIISSSVTDKFQNMLDEDLLLIAMKKKLDQTKIDSLNELIQSLINIVNNFFSPDFFRAFFDGLKKEYEQLDFKDLNIFNMIVNGKIMVEFDKYSNIIGTSFQTMKEQIYNDLIKKALNDNPKFKEIMNGIELTDIFSNYLEKIFQDLITSLPIITINILTSLIPNPFFINLLHLIENYGYKSIQTILFLLLNEAANVVNKLDKLNEAANVVNKLDKLNESANVVNKLDKLNESANVVNKLDKLNESANVVNKLDKSGGKKRGKTQKQYYLNRIHNTIKNFYKTNKTRFRKR